MLALLYVLIFLIIGVAILRRPLLGLFFAVVCELWLANFFLFGNYYLRLRLILLPYILLVIFIWLTYSGVTLRMNRTVLTFLAIQATMVAIVILVNVAHSNPIEVAAVQIARVGVSLVITMVLYLLIDNIHKLKQYLFVTGCALGVSAIVGILQAVFGGVFYEFKALLVGHTDLALIDIRGEASGLALYSLMLAYQIVCTLPLFMSLFIYSAAKTIEGYSIAITAIILTLGLFLTKVRSAIVGIVVWTAGAMFLQKTASKVILNRKVVILSTAIALFVFAYLVFPMREVLSLRDRSAQARLPLNVVGIKIALEHPLGIGSVREFNEFSADNYEIVAHMKGAEAVRYLAPHNQFLNTLLYWGIPGFVMLLCLFFYKFSVLLRLLRCRDRFIWTVSFGILGASVAYVVTSFFHNAGPFNGDIFYWYIIGLIPVLVRLSNRRYVLRERDETSG